MNQLTINRMPGLSYAVTEALNQLRVNLSFCGDDIKVIMITSSLPNEGKSFLSIHLWKMLADVGCPSLLIDCDLRNSRFGGRYGISGDGKIKGIAHYLSGNASLEEVVYQTNVENGSMIPNMTTIVNPAILLESPRFQKMIDSLRGEFQYILIDTPPLGSVADAMNIATHCDGNVLVIRSGETPRKVVYDSVRLLERTNKPLLGTVLNRVEISNKVGYYNRYYHYGDYYSSGNKSRRRKK